MPPKKTLAATKAELGNAKRSRSSNPIASAVEKPQPNKIARAEGDNDAGAKSRVRKQTADTAVTPQQAYDALTSDPLTINTKNPFGSSLESVDTWIQLIGILGMLKHMLLRGTCQAGKTSFAHRGTMYAAANMLPGVSAIHVFSPDEAAAACALLKREGPKDSEDLVIVCFDEAHRWFKENEKFVKNVAKFKQSPRHFRFVWITTATQLPDLDLTPRELTPYWFHGPNVNHDELRKYVDLVLAVDTTLAKDDSLRDRMARSIMMSCGLHVGLISALLRSALYPRPDGSRDASRGVRCLHPSLLYNNRALGGGNGTWTTVQLELMKTLLRCGSVTLDLKSCHDEAKELVRKGYLAPVINYANVSALCALGTDASKFTFTHPFQADRFRALSTMQLTCKMSAQDVVVALLPLMPAHCFQSAALRGSTSALAEAPLQDGFYFAACTAGVAVDAEMAVRDCAAPGEDAAAAGRGRPPACDFVLRLPAAGASAEDGRVWPDQRDVAIEFLTDNGDKNVSMKKHLDRFGKGREYAALNSNFVVVSFEMKQTSTAITKNTMVVSPHPALGWSVFVVQTHGEKEAKYVARNGVLDPALSHTVGTSSVASVGSGAPAVPAVVWVQQRSSAGQLVGVAFMVSPAMNNVDALKDAIKAKAPATVKCDAFAISIFAPGATTPAEPDLALSESDAKKPFHFALP